MAWRRLKLQWILASGIAIEISGPADWEAYNEIFVNGEYDSAILAALQRVGSEPITILDLGSNFGFFCLRILDLAHSRRIALQLPEFTMVEGSERILEELRLRKSYQVLADSGAQIIHGLVGRKTGSAVLYETHMHLFNSIVDKRGPGSSPVFFVDLERLFTKHERIDLLKCDIQGAEEEFLENNPLLLRKTSVAVLELHHLLCNTGHCLQMLTGSGFARITTVRHNDAVSIVVCER